jgi:hypothetical protein
MLVLGIVAVIAVAALLFLGTQAPTVLSTISGGGGDMISEP